MRQKTFVRLGTAMLASIAILGGCGNDGRELMAPTTIPPVTVPPTSSTASILVVDPDRLPAEDVSETAPPTEPPTTVSAAALAESPDICGPYAKVISLEESRAVVRSQGEAAMIASEQRRTLELERLGSSLDPATPLDILSALNDLKAVDMATEQPDARHDEALNQVRTHFSPICQVGQ